MMDNKAGPELWSEFRPRAWELTAEDSQLSRVVADEDMSDFRTRRMLVDK